MKSHILLMMGGSGTRIGGDIPKQYIEIEGQPIFSYILEKCNNFEGIERIVIVSHESWIDYVQEWVKKVRADKVVEITAGGDTRSHSVRNGLRALREFANDDDAVLIHDATHPYFDEEGTKGVIEAIREFGGATLGEYQYDTVYRIDESDFIAETVPRERIVAGASPEGFRFGMLYKIYEESTDEELAKMTSAGAIATACGIKMKVIPCNVVNLKITYKNDLDALKHTADYFLGAQGEREE